MKTADELGAGTDSNVYLTIIAEKGEHSKVPLNNSKSGKNKFEKGSLDKFDLDLKDSGKVCLINFSS